MFWRWAGVDPTAKLADFDEAATIGACPTLHFVCLFACQIQVEVARWCNFKLLRLLCPEGCAAFMLDEVLPTTFTSIRGGWHEEQSSDNCSMWKIP